MWVPIRQLLTISLPAAAVVVVVVFRGVLPNVYPITSRKSRPQRRWQKCKPLSEHGRRSCNGYIPDDAHHATVIRARNKRREDKEKGVGALSTIVVTITPCKFREPRLSVRLFINDDKSDYTDGLPRSLENTIGITMPGRILRKDKMHSHLHSNGIDVTVKGGKCERGLVASCKYAEKQMRSCT